MSTVLNYVSKRSTIKRKVLDIKSDIMKTIRQYCIEGYYIWYYGNFEMNPGDLVFWICVQSDGMKRRLETNSTLRSELEEILIRNNYPKSARATVHIGVESKETVDRVSNGNWFYHCR